jgi:type 1 glutamine amidotransferase
VAGLVVLAVLSPWTILADEPKPPTVVFLIGEDEYETEKTLPAWAKERLEPAGIKCRYVLAKNETPHDFAGMEKLDDADVVAISIRRRAPKEEQLAALRKAIDRDVGVFGIRTACHAFAMRPGESAPEGHATWPEFDREVLGCHYQNHWGNKADTDPRTLVRLADKAQGHPLLSGWPTDPSETVVRSWLYNVHPVDKNAVPLLIGHIPGRTKDDEHEPVAWTIEKGKQRIFNTTLGHPDEFKQKPVADLLTAAMKWVAKQPLEK